MVVFPTPEGPETASTYDVTVNIGSTAFSTTSYFRSFTMRPFSIVRIFRICGTTDAPIIGAAWFRVSCAITFFPFPSLIIATMYGSLPKPVGG